MEFNYTYTDSTDGMQSPNFEKLLEKRNAKGCQRRTKALNSQKEAVRAEGVSTDSTMVSADTSIGDADGISRPVCDKTFKSLIIHLQSQAKKDARYALEMEDYNVCAY